MVLLFGNESVVEGYKPDEGVNVVLLRPRKDLGRQVQVMNLHETDGDERPSRGMNLKLAHHFWSEASDKPPSWVEGDDELLVRMASEEFGCPVGRPKGWRAG